MSFTLNTIDEYISALMLNAAQLVRESQVLYDAEGYARAFALAHFAREELSKVMMLEATGARMLAGHPVDSKLLIKRLKDHKAKLRLEVVQNAILFAALGKSEDAEEMLMNGQAIADARNNDKNASLYVAFDDVVSIPAEVITEAKALRTIGLATHALMNQQKIRETMGPYSSRSATTIPSIEPTIENILALSKVFAKVLTRNSEDQQKE